MTFFHFVNCLALTYTPYFITYKYSGLAEYSSVWKCAQAGGAYLLTQLCKLLILATFFPTSEMEGQRFDLLPEFMKSTVDLADIVGLYLVIGYSMAGKGEVRFLAAGLGWATADCLATRLVGYWVGARGVGFDWKYTQMGLESNINLVHFLSVGALVWLWNRHDLPWHMHQVTASLLLYAAYRNFIYELLVNFTALSSWPLLMVKLLLTTTVAVSACVVYGSLNKRENSR